MFELAWSKVLIIAIAAIVVVGPKDLPMVLRTIGKYLGYLRRQADEFKQQFEEAMREAEIDTVKKEFEEVKKTTEDTMRGIEQGVDETMKSAGHIGDDIDRAGASPTPPDLSSPTGPAEPDPALAPPAVESSSQPAAHEIVADTATPNGSAHRPNGAAPEPALANAHPTAPRQHGGEPT